MCIAGAGQLFLEVMQTEAIVNALLQDTAEFAVTLDNNDFFSTILPCAVSSRIITSYNWFIIIPPRHLQNIFRRTYWNQYVLLILREQKCSARVPESG